MDRLLRVDPAVADRDDLTAMRSLFVPGPMPTAEEYERQRREHWESTVNAIRERNGLEPLKCGELGLTECLPDPLRNAA